MSWPAVAVGLMMITAGTALFLKYVWRQVAPYLPTSVATRLANIVAWRVADAEAVITATHIAPGMRVLDVGCGKGRLTIAVARQVFPCGSVVGVDIDKKCVNKLTEKLALPGVANAEAVWSDINHLNLPASTFDRVLMVASFGSIQDKQAALHKLYAAMKPNGVLSVTEVALDANRVGFEIVQQLACRAGFLQDYFSRTWLSYTVNFVKRGAGSASPAVAEKAGYGRAEETVVVPTALGLRVVRDAKPIGFEDFDPRPDPVTAGNSKAERAVVQIADSAKLEDADGAARPRKVRLIA